MYMHMCTFMYIHAFFPNSAIQSRPMGLAHVGRCQKPTKNVQGRWVTQPASQGAGNGPPAWIQLAGNAWAFGNARGARRMTPKGQERQGYVPLGLLPAQPLPQMPPPEHVHLRTGVVSGLRVNRGGFRGFAALPWQALLQRGLPLLQ